MDFDVTIDKIVYISRIELTFPKTEQMCINIYFIHVKFLDLQRHVLHFLMHHKSTTYDGDKKDGSYIEIFVNQNPI